MFLTLLPQTQTQSMMSMMHWIERQRHPTTGQRQAMTMMWLWQR
jgi:hypothetical protein